MSVVHINFLLMLYIRIILNNIIWDKWGKQTHPAVSLTIKSKKTGHYPMFCSLFGGVRYREMGRFRRLTCHSSSTPWNI